MTTTPYLPAGARVTRTTLRPMAERPAWICTPCLQAIRHDQCEVRNSASVLCCCLQCGLRRAIAEARRVLDIPPGRPGREQLLASSVRSWLAFEDARTRRKIRMKRKGFLPPFPCACHRTIKGQPCMVANAQNRRRQYARPGCRNAALRQRKRIEHRAQAMAEAAAATRDQHQPPMPADPRKPHWRR